MFWVVNPPHPIGSSTHRSRFRRRPGRGISKHYTLDRDNKKFLKEQALFGTEIVDGTARLCAMYLFLHGIGGEEPVTVADALNSKGSREFDMVLTNPPFGKKSSISWIVQRQRRVCNQRTSFCCIHSSRTETRKRQTLPICKPRISPHRASFWSVLGWIRMIAAAWFESNSGSGKNAPGDSACKRALGGSASAAAAG
jgi:hypothetical protein